MPKKFDWTRALVGGGLRGTTKYFEGRIEEDKKEKEEKRKLEQLRAEEGIKSEYKTETFAEQAQKRFKVEELPLEQAEKAAGIYIPKPVSGKEKLPSIAQKITKNNLVYAAEINAGQGKEFGENVILPLKTPQEYDAYVASEGGDNTDPDIILAKAKGYKMDLVVIKEDGKKGTMEVSEWLSSGKNEGYEIIGARSKK